MNIRNKIDNIFNKLFLLLSSFRNIICSATIKDIPEQIRNMVFGDDKLFFLVDRTIQQVSESDLQGITLIGSGVFEGCTNLTSITISDSITSINSSAFSQCTNLTSVTIPDSVTSIGTSAFRDCTRLTSITIPDSVTSIGSFAFNNCTSLTSVTIGNGVTNIGSSAFFGCKVLKKVYASDIISWLSLSFANEDSTPLTTGAELYFDNQLVTELIIPNSVTSIGSFAFNNCTSLTSVTIGNGVTNIGEHAFENCTNLTSTIIPNSVKSIDKYAFRYCTNLTSITIPNSVKSIDKYAFYGCTGLTSIYLDSITPPSLGDRWAIPSNSNLTIHVPVGSGEAYKSATNWSYHSAIIVEDIVI